MPKIDQYLNYVDFYTKISKITTLCIPLLLRSTPISQPPEHLYRSLIGTATPVCSCAVYLEPTVLQWQFLQSHNGTDDHHGHPLVLCE
jgi:hypothetical protein